MALTTNAIPNFSVAIIGAGLGGLQLARILQQRGVHSTVYERETSPISRNQGGNLDIHPESGQRALQLAGLSEEFLKIAHPEADTFWVRDKTGRVTFDEKDLADLVEGPPRGPEGPGGQGERHGQARDEYREVPLMEGRPEVDRGELRQILLDSLLPNTIKWGYNLSSCELVGDDKVELHFSEPQSQAASFDMVVGADGTWSRVRPLLSSVSPEYTGVTFVDIQLTDVDAKLPEISKLVGAGSLFALGDNKGILAQRNNGGNVRVYVSLRVPLSWPESSGISTLVAEEQFSKVQELLSEFFEDWSETLRSMISSADLERSAFAVRPLMMLPSDHAWKTIGRVTLLGDAAHVMSPFAGEGANLAMLDGAELGEAIASYLEGGRGAALVDVIGEFETRMLARSTKSSEESIRNQTVFMSDNAAAKIGDLMRHLMSGGGPPP